MVRPGFIHGTSGVGTVTRRRRTPGSPDAEGIVTYTPSDVSLAQARVNVLSARERSDLGALSQDADGSILVPLGTDVTDHDQMIVAGLRTELDGTWEVVAVRDATIHLRVLCRKVNQ